MNKMKLARRREVEGDSAAPTLPRSVVLVGLMGAGKSSLGRQLGALFNVPFVDADAEIEAAAGCTIAEIFEIHGEAAFRDGERRVIARLLAGPTRVLATGGGAFIDPETRRRIERSAISVWLKADLDTLVRRTSRRGQRPLLAQGDPRQILARLIAEREPVYAKADIIVESDDRPVEETVVRVVRELERYIAASTDP